jgi:hypothetical protein
MARLSQGVPSAPLMHVLPTLLSLVLLVLANGLFGQSKKAKDRIREDTLYVTDLSRRPTLRLYGSNKFNSMVVRSNKGFTDLRYRPNGKYIIGVGASYRRLTLNIGVPMPFVNTDNESLRTHALFGRTSQFAHPYAVIQFVPTGIQRVPYHIPCKGLVALGPNNGLPLS